MVAQRQPKSFQCLSQPQTRTVSNQLRTKRSSDLVALRSKVQQLYLLHTACFLRPEKTRKKQNSFASHLSNKTPWRKNTLHSTNQKTQCGGSYLERSTKPRPPATLWVGPVLDCKNFWRSETAYLEAKLLENEPVRKDTAGCFHLRSGDQTPVPSRH